MADEKGVSVTRTWGATLALLGLLGAACGSSSETTTQPPPTQAQSQVPTTAVAAYPVTVRNCGVDYVFTKAPERVVASSVPGTELMLALGLEKKLAGVVGPASAITPELQTRIAGVSVITERTFPPAGREQLLSANPDLIVSGYSEDFAENAAGDRASLKSLGVASYLVQGKCGGAETTLDDTYADIENLGRIFDVKPAAAAVVATLKAEAAAAAPVTTRPKVLIYAAGRERASTSGTTTLVDDLVTRAGGQNVLGEIATFSAFGWETVVDRNPDVIVVVNTGSFTREQAAEFLSTYEPIAEVNAVKNKRFVFVAVNDVQPGVRNGRALAAIARGLAGG